MTPDVNVLLAASRDDHPHHRVALEWLEAAIAESASGGRFTLIPMVTASYLRLATSPRIFAVPTPMADAIGFVDALAGAPGTTTAALGGEWPVLRQLCLDKKLLGNDLPDAWLAAAVMQLGEHLATFDADFKKLLRRNQLTLLTASRH
jgi:toxin-antitoxin system PIN domain toxin